MRLDEVIMYHGSQTRNPVFFKRHTGNNSHTFGNYNSTRYGAFFTDNPKFAKLYGQVQSYDINVRRTLDLDKDRGNTIAKFIKTLDPHGPDREVWLAANNVLRGSWAYWHLFEDDLGEKFTKFLEENGYDSASFRESNSDDNGRDVESKTVVVFDIGRIRRKTNNPNLELDL